MLLIFEEYIKEKYLRATYTSLTICTSAKKLQPGAKWIQVCWEIGIAIQRSSPKVAKL